MSRCPVVMLAGGLGTRVRALADAAGIPKALLPVNGVPFIDLKLAELARAGVDDVLMLVGHRGEVLEQHLSAGATGGLRLRFRADGPRLLGTGGAIRQVLAELPELFWVTYGDTLLEVPVAAIEADFAARSELGAMTVLRNEDRWEPSNAAVEGDLVVGYGKGAPAGTFDHIDYGMLLLRRAAFDVVSPAQERFDLDAVVGPCIARRALRAYLVQERFHDVGTPEALRETETWLAAGR